MRCPHCLATNPETAAFCGQCYELFAVPEEFPAVMASEEIPVGVTPTEDVVARPLGVPVAVGRFVATDGGLTWRCAMCETTNAVGVFGCTVCGAKMDAEARPDGAPHVDLGRARRLESMVPGLGHLRTGHSGMGAARMGIVVVWLLGAVFLAGGGASGLVTALPLVLGIAAIWVTGPGDLAAVDGGRSPRLDARRFMYLVIGVTTGVILAGGLVVIL